MSNKHKHNGIPCIPGANSPVAASTPDTVVKAAAQTLAPSSAAGIAPVSRISGPQNLEQIRAKNAVNQMIGQGENGGENVAKKFPSLIINNGLIATVAFACEKGKGYDDVARAIIRHLKDPAISLYKDKEDAQSFLEFLANSDSNVLRKVTAETLAFLNYLRRLS